ncbi:MAG: nucleotide-diphospho-sugar transferase, partial [Bacteroidota bacterium]
MQHPEQLSTPVLMIIFNRADTTQRVFEAIKAVKPTSLYIAADGPRSGKEGEALMCAQTRAIAEQVDWPCTVKTRFRDDNLGCGRGPASAISWFFEQEEAGIILEDDCVADPCFFSFCENLLNRYQHDSRVMHIGGFNIQFGQQHGPASYYFSQYPEVWGWATWRRAWQTFDFHMTDYPQFKAENQLANVFSSTRMQHAWEKKLDYTYHQNPPSIWDYRWMYTVWKHHGLCITPNQSLVQNIGFDGRGTHTNQQSEVQRAFAGIQATSLGELIHPAFQTVAHAADQQTEKMRVMPPI